MLRAVVREVDSSNRPLLSHLAMTAAPTAVTAPARDSHPAMSIEQVPLRPEPERDWLSPADAALQAPVPACML